MVEVIQEGLEPVKEGAPINTRKVDNVVVAKVIDEKRDDKAGVPLSRFNLNYIFQPRDPRDKSLKMRYKAPINESLLPKKADLELNWGEVVDQGDVGSCVANSVAYCIRFVRQREKLTVYQPSRLYIYYYGRQIEGFSTSEDSGMFIRSGYKAVAKHSVCSEKNWPYNTDKFDVEPNLGARNAAAFHRKFEYLAVDHDLPSIKKCLADGYPISFGFTVFASFMSAEVARTGIVPMPDFANEQQFGGHAVTMVGYDDETRLFKIVNSWGPQWGRNGFCYMPYDFLLNWKYANDFWTARVFK